MESASYNPSLGPVQAALVAFVASGGGGYDEIVAAVLVEKEEAVVRQGDTARWDMLHGYVHKGFSGWPSHCWKPYKPAHRMIMNFVQKRF
ncbi:hypothetical protein AgCh_017396 [Apium graveolens]